MKTTLLFRSGLACALLTLRSVAAPDVAADWYDELGAAQQTLHQNLGGRVRANAILRTILDATKNGISANEQFGRSAEPVPVDANLEAATAQSAYSALAVLYPQDLSTLDARLAKSLAAIGDSAEVIAAGKKWGEHVAQVVLTEAQDAVVLNPSTLAAEVQASTPSTPAPAVQAAPLSEKAPIGPGRYRFSHLAGVPGTKGYVDATGVAARFDNPGGIAVDVAGNVYLSERTMGTVRRISSEGTVTTFAGTAGQEGRTDGIGIAARFNQPTGLAVDGMGNVYVADTGNSTIRKIDPSGKVSTVAGIAGASGNINGTRETARLNQPAYVAVDTSGNLFFTETSSSASPLIRKVAPDGSVTSLTILPNANRSYYGPEQLCTDGEGNLYVNAWITFPNALWDDKGILKLAPTTQEGTYSVSELAPPEDFFGDPTGISLDENDSLYIKAGGDALHVYSPNGGWQTRYPSGVSELDGIEQFAVGKSGKLFAFRNQQSDNDKFGVVEIGVFDADAKGPVLLSQPYDRWNRVGDSASFWVNAAGGPALSYQWYFNSTPIKGATESVCLIGNVQASDEGYYSVVVSDEAGSLTSRKAIFAVFDKSAPGPGTGTLSLPPGFTLPSGGVSGSSVSGTGSSSSNSSSGTGAVSPASTASGGGSFDVVISLTVLILLGGAASRRRGTLRRGSQCQTQPNRGGSIV